MGGEQAEEALRLASAVSYIEVSHKNAACALPTMQAVRSAKPAYR